MHGKRSAMCSSKSRSFVLYCFLLTHADWSITRSEWLWLAMGDSGSLWVAMGGYGSLWVAMACSGSFRCLVPPLFREILGKFYFDVFQIKFLFRFRKKSK